ncbi:bifunctional 3-(3-hydroxy-phenyl)propionate/3-hydroxycinnamic acid hydroxylase MhpA [Corynebacterium terpenotabidum]|uniref:3-(3-hydroxyphenyl)propionate hydroxylase n=1 Tax=Corynebacterium terpenotabidum Y-11 TaxID=1200352 RepID=S4XE58_9CORY|nr:bifunctional 3-(3-hydroxy-phenyl)propionate/3-hydroxycinnamic acid hydroxylase [Corynebacterium terpenotabidum]AGP29885.1 3-(3-hydroxyphenyl)propionate hydroxylase [Corynebacterium terpenotabidum Y-11]
MSTAESTAPVLIAGGGPTGLSLACLLAESGVRSTILERWPECYPLPRAVHMDDEVARMLSMVGVGDGFAGISRPARGLRLVDRDLRVLAEFPRELSLDRDGFPSASMYNQPDLEVLLRTEVAQRPEITVVTGVELRDVLQDAGSVAVTVADPGTGALSVHRGRWLVGCDGANSLVRRTCGTGWQDFGFRQRWLVLDVDLRDGELDQWEGVQQLCDSRRPGTYMRIGEHSYRWEFRLDDGEAATDFTTLDAVLPLIRPWLGSGADAVPATDLVLVRSAEYAFRSCVAQRWRTGRILLAGDAAHLTPPFIGQGLGAGQRDAANLAWKLAAVIHGTAPSSILDTYEAERRPHATALIRLAVLLGRVMTGGGTTGDHLRGSGMGAVVRMVNHIPAISRFTHDSATPPLRRTRLWSAARNMLPDRSANHRLVGRLAPNALVESTIRLDACTGYRFNVITLDEPSPEQEREVARRGAVLLRVGPTSPLGWWLRQAKARAAVIRPDRTVLAAGPSLSKVYNHLPATLVTAKETV